MNLRAVVESWVGLFAPFATDKFYPSTIWSCHFGGGPLLFVPHFGSSRSYWGNDENFPNERKDKTSVKDIVF